MRNAIGLIAFPLLKLFADNSFCGIDFKLGKVIKLNWSSVRKEQWDSQKGICPYTGWQLKNMASFTNRLPKTPDRASLDRIDSKKGYIKGNIQFVALIVQLAKNDWDEKVIYEFAEAIKKPTQILL